MASEERPAIIKVVGPILYVHRDDCADPDAGATYLVGKIWRCQSCHVRVGIKW